jgi:hypothetical protein
VRETQGLKDLDSQVPFRTVSKVLDEQIDVCDQGVDIKGHAEELELH